MTAPESKYMINEEISHAIYHVPENADYAVDSTELDPEDIDPARVEVLKAIITNDTDDPKNNYLHFGAARVLCSWGYRCGFDMISKYVSREDLMEGPGEISHRIRGYNTGYEHALMAIWSYHATQSDRGYDPKERKVTDSSYAQESRKLIFDVTVKIIEYSNSKQFEINRLYGSLRHNHYEEYYPHIKNHLLSIIDNPEFHHWKIFDALEFLNGVDPEFVASVLKPRGKTIADYK